jgi:hypothetical protein
MQWVGTPPLASVVAMSGALGMLTALTQPSPEALRQAIRETRNRMEGRPGKFVSRFGAHLLIQGRQHHPSPFNQPSRLVYRLVSSQLTAALDTLERRWMKEWRSSRPREITVSVLSDSADNSGTFNQAHSDVPDPWILCPAEAIYYSQVRHHSTRTVRTEDGCGLFEH